MASKRFDMSEQLFSKNNRFYYRLLKLFCLREVNVYAMQIKNKN